MPAIHCPTCHRPFVVDAAFAGRVVGCPACRHPLTVPHVQPAPAADLPPEFIPDDSPPRRVPRQSPALAVMVAGLCFAAIAAAAVGGWVYVTRQEPATKGAPPATEPPAAAVAPARMDDAAFGKIKRATVYIRIAEADRVASGSGFYFGNGLVMTNHHVIDYPGKIEVVVGRGTRGASTRAARVVRSDRGRDLAILEVDGATHPEPLQISTSSGLRETQDLYVFGFPLGERLGEEITVSKSSVSSLRLNGPVAEIQLNGGIHPGNSGGPVADATGRVVGVAVAAIRNTTINFAIAGEEARNFVSERR